ncbi:MAG: acetyl-CoA synthetase [Solirubrobacteraceae bacterium]|jgi:acetyl-CoA synthetase|nr:acetyl-CoA synthetase [Solirubrobacteraceae bacterium]
MATEERTDKSLEEELEKLLEVERFPPPEEFRANAVVQDPAIYDEAERDPEGFWAEQAKRLDWFEEWDQVLDWSNPPFAKWFVGGKLNASYNCVDRHVEAGLGDRVALHWRGEEGEERDITYADLHRDVQRFANVLKDHGIGKGDIVGIFLPMIPEVVVAMLACARIGAPHNVVFGGFSAESVKERMEFSDAKALVTVDGARRKGKTAPIKQQVDEVMGEVATMETIFVVKHTGEDCEMQDGRDVWFGEAMDAAAAECPAEPLDAEHPLYVLYTSGSTAKPKGVLHTTGGYLTGVAYTHKVVFDLKPESDVFWCGADVGWVTGHSYIVYGPLANGATSVMYEGAPDYPDKDVWWEIIERYGVSIFYTAPTAIRACMKWGPKYPGKHDLSSLRLLGTVGEPINPKAWLWYHAVIGGERCPIVDTWWQTETGHIMISPLPGITETKPGSATFPLPGIDAAVVTEKEGDDAGTSQGLLVLRRPWPGMLRTLYRDDERYVETYWNRFGKETYLVGDAARRDKDGYFWVIGRIDDVINVSGHRLSTAEVESAVVSHPKVAECAVVGQSDEDTGQAICAFVTLEGTVDIGDEALEQEIRDHVAQKIGKLARPKRIIWSADLPKTRSGKIMRRLLRDIGEGRELGDVTTLRDPEVVKDLEAKVGSEEE